MSNKEDKRIFFINGDILIICGIIMSLFLMFFFYHLGFEISKSKEKISSLEDIVFNQDVYLNIKNIKTKGE